MVSDSGSQLTPGTELWRLGTPDKTAGEFRHGFAKDPDHTLHPEEYRSYWGAWDFPTDFPQGVNFTIGESNEAEDWVGPSSNCLTAELCPL